MKKPKPPCRHCGRRPANRPRRLCWTCYELPAVRALYPVAPGAAARRGLGWVNRLAPLPAAPTDTPPGSPARLAVLAARAAAGEALHHPHDARIDRGPPTGPRRARVHLGPGEEAA